MKSDRSRLSFVAILFLTAWIRCEVGRAEDIQVGGGTIHIFIQGQPPVPLEAIRSWVTTAATAVSQYDGKYPVAQVRLQIVCDDSGGAVQGGFEYQGKFIHIKLGRQTTPQILKDNWELTHEMFHLSFPDLDDKYLWMEEGMADYLEPIARARIGNLSEAEVWKGYVEGMPNGQPEKGDQGLDHTHTWGRTYWGGCTFWLLADVQIREQTHNAKSVDDAFRAILNAGGNDTQPWALARVLDTGDQATGTTVLKDLHDQMGDKPITVDLDALWKKLGVVYSHHAITFDDSAPLAAIRKSMTAPATQPASR